MSYLFLFCAIFSEVVSTSLLKSTAGFTRLWPTVICLVGYVGVGLIIAGVVTVNLAGAH